MNLNAVLPDWMRNTLLAKGGQTAVEPPAKPDGLPDTLAIEAEGELKILEAASEGEEAAKLPTFSMLAYGGGKMRPVGFGVDVVLDLAGTKIASGKRPALYQHRSDQPVGHFDAGGIVNDGRKIHASGTLSVACEERDRIVQSSREGFPWKGSIGARYSWADMEFIEAGESAEVNGKKQRGPFYLVKAATIFEISFVTIAGDDTSRASVKATTSTEGIAMTFEAWLKAKGFDLTKLTAQQHASLRASWEAELKASGQTPGDGPEDPAAGGDQEDPETDGLTASGSTGNSPAQRSTPPSQQPANTPSAAALHQEMRMQAAGEIERQGAIRKLFAASSLADDKRHELHAQAVRENWTAEKVELEILRASRADVTGAPGPAIHIGGQHGVTAGVLTASLATSLGLPETIVAQGMSEQEMNQAAEARHRNLSLHALMDLCIRAATGHTYTGANRKSNDFIRAAAAADRALMGQNGYSSLQASGNTTISLTGILGNVANKSLIAAFQSIETTYGELSRKASHGDFKVHTRYRLDINGGYQKVAGDGQLKHSAMSETAFQSKIDTFGTMLTLTRQDMINDDLDAFNQITTQLGVMAAIVMEEEFWKMVLGNAGSFFSEGNKNLLTGTDYALSIDGLTGAVAKFRHRVKGDGAPVLLTPKLLVTGSSLEVTADELYTETNVDVTTTANKPKIAANKHKGKYRPVATPYIDNTDILDRQGKAISGQSDTLYFLLADPAVRSAFVCATLNGQATPTIESDESAFNTLGMQWRGYHDFGFGFEEPEAVLMVTGAA